jgi:tRNA A-37 threonylcarbamoyl transferase component Bud32
MVSGQGRWAAILGAAALGAAAGAFLAGGDGRARQDDAVRASNEARAALQAATTASLRALGAEAEAAVAIPQFRSALADRMDAFTLQDLFQTEDWWAPYRARALTLTGPSGPIVKRNVPGGDLGAAELVANAAGTRPASAVVRSGDGVFLVAAAAVNAPDLLGWALILGQPIDAALLNDWSARAHAGVLVSDGRQVLLAPVGPQPGKVDELVGHEGESPIVDTGGDWAAAPLALGPGLWLWSIRRLTAGAAGSLARPLWGLAGLLGALALALAATRRRAAEPAPLKEGHASGPPMVPLGRPSANASTMIASGEAQVFGRYTVLDRLGEGGMCDIYTAALTGPEGFQRTFVLKRLKPEIARNRAAIDQFIDEAKLGSTLVHSNIVPVFDFGKVGDGYFIAQEYILGRNIAQLIERHAERLGEPLDVATVFYIASETLQALGYAHDRTDESGAPLNIVHRDVSPGNVIVSRQGEVKLIDFGIVKAEGRVSHTDMGNVKGNAAFMAPEQARGLPVVDRRADLFSLGLVMYRALAGEPFYKGGTTAEVFYSAANGPTEDHFGRLDRLLPAAASILKKALAPDPADRYATAEEFAAALAPHVQPGTKARLAALMHALFGDELRPLSGGGGGGTNATSALRRGAGQGSP